MFIITSKKRIKPYKKQQTDVSNHSNKTLFSWAVHMSQFPIKVYQKWISPLKPPTCRFYPSCSTYAIKSLEIYGIRRGTWLIMKRILKCHPFHSGGIDHVPHKE